MKKSLSGKNEFKTERTSSTASRIAVLLLLAAFVAAPPLRTQSASAGKRSIADVEAFIKGVVEGAITEREAIQKIGERGIDFVATPENLARLRADGATQGLLEAISKLAPQPPKPTGKLSLHCAPAECVIKINGNDAGATVGGQFEKILDVGHLMVTFEKLGYVSKMEEVELTHAAPASLSAQLEPTSDTQRANGKQLLLLSRQALGVETDLKAVSVLTGGGAITSYAGAKQSQWNFDFTVAQPNLIEMKVESATGSFVYQCKGERCEEKKKKSRIGFIGSGKAVKGADLEMLQTNLRAFAQYNFAAMLERLLDSEAQLDSVTATFDHLAEQHLHVETQQAIYAVTISRELFPSVIEYESKSGLGSGLKVLFADFTKLGDAQYPKRTTIKLPDSAQHGIEVRLDHVAPGSELHESDFAK